VSDKTWELLMIAGWIILSALIIARGIVWL